MPVRAAAAGTKGREGRLIDVRVRVSQPAIIPGLSNEVGRVQDRPI
jgi:hypothetical protein